MLILNGALCCVQREFFFLFSNSSIGCFFEFFFSQIEIADIGHSLSNSSSNNEQISCSNIKSCGRKQFRIDHLPFTNFGTCSIRNCFLLHDLILLQLICSLFEEELLTECPMSAISICEKKISKKQPIDEFEIRKKNSR